MGERVLRASKGVRDTPTPTVRSPTGTIYAEDLGLNTSFNFLKLHLSGTFIYFLWQPLIVSNTSEHIIELLSAISPLFKIFWGSGFFTAIVLFCFWFLLHLSLRQ